MITATILHVAHVAWHVALWFGAGSIFGALVGRLRGCERCYSPVGEWP